MLNSYFIANGINRVHYRLYGTYIFDNFKDACNNKEEFLEFFNFKCQELASSKVYKKVL